MKYLFSNTSRTRLLVLGACTAFILIGTYAVFAMQGRSADDAVYQKIVKQNMPQNHDFWSAQIRERGARKAYDSFKKATVGISSGRLHLLAHVFGTALYETEGAAGVVTCDDTSGYGCFHGFFIAAVHDLGLSSIHSLDAACVRAFGPVSTGCQHGIGHGILEFLGTTKLAEALELCGQTTESTPLVGCSAGVFMEHFVQIRGILEASPTVTTLPYTASTPYGPCDSVPERYQPACYWALPGWWSGELEGTALNDFVGRCAALTGPVRQACFLGVGNVAGTQGFSDIKKTAQICDAAATGDARTFCYAGAARHFYYITADKKSLQSVCGQLAEDERAACLIGADYTKSLGLNPP